jgi:excisionase family DNA binding protein
MLTLPEVATIARAPLPSVRRWLADGRLRGKRVGKRILVAETELARFMGLTARDLRAAAA